MLKAFLIRNKERWRFLKPLWGAYRTTCAALPWRWLPGTSRTFGPPRGLHRWTADYLASGVAHMDDAMLEVAPGHEMTLPAPRSIESELHWKYRQTDRVTVAAKRVFDLHQVRFWGDYSGTLIGRNDRVLGDLTIDVWEATRHKIFTQVKLPRCRHLPGVTAVLSSAEAESNYWHWTLEVLPKVELLRRAGWPVTAIDWFVVNHRDHEFQRETLADLGIPAAKIVRADASLHAECDRALIVAPKDNQYAVTADECAFLNERATRLAPGARLTRRLFLSRDRAVFRRVTNETEVKALLTAQGFEIFRCEDHSVAEQRRAFREAAVIVGAHGAALTNVVYAQAGGKLLELMAPRYIDPAFRAIAAHAGVEHWVLVGEGTQPSEGVDPLARQQDITVSMDRLKQTLEAMGL